jgi:hypothetical protein
LHFNSTPYRKYPRLLLRLSPGNLPSGVERIDAPTPFVCIIGRTQTNGPGDYEAVHKIQDGFQITPLSQLGKPEKKASVEIDPTVDMKMPPLEQLTIMKAERFLPLAAELLMWNPPHITDQPIIARMTQRAAQHRAVA